jgi:hypothetical protein
MRCGTRDILPFAAGDATLLALPGLLVLQV